MRDDAHSQDQSAARDARASGGAGGGLGGTVLTVQQAADLLHLNQLLYRLSYISARARIIGV